MLFVNCGSVGKPKDGDARGAFAVLDVDDTGRVRARIERVTYDIEGVAQEVAACRAARRVRRQAAGRRVTHALTRRLLAEYLGSALLAAVVFGSGITAQQLSNDTGLQLLQNAAATATGLFPRSCIREKQQ